MNIVIMIVLGLLFIFGIVLAYLGARNWPASHTVLLFFVFFAALIFMILAGGTLQTQANWRGEFESKQAELERTKAAIEELRFGQNIDQRGQSIFGLRARLSQEVIDRGRVWRGVKPNGVAQNSIVVDMTDWGNAGWTETVGADDEFFDEEPPDGGAAPPTQPHGIVDGMVIYLFQEVPLNRLGPAAKVESLFHSPEANEDEEFSGGSLVEEFTARETFRLPTFYLGQFRVTSVADHQVTLQPNEILDAKQIEMIQNQSGTWSLYETMPLDTHRAFAGRTKEQIEALFPAAEMGITDEQYTQLIDQYARDGQRATDADPPERKWRRVKFLKTQEVDVDAVLDENRQWDGERDFNSAGQAISPQLRQSGTPEGEPTTFEEGDVALLDSETATRLINEGVCELDGDVEQPNEVYIRELRDYDYLYQNLALAQSEINDQITTTQIDNKSLAESHTRATEQIANRQDEGSKLQSDVTGFQHEIGQLSKLNAELQTVFEKQKQMLSYLYRANKKLNTDLAAVQGQIDATQGQNGRSTGSDEPPTLLTTSSPPARRQVR